MSKNTSFSQSLPSALYDELATLAKEYTDSQPNTLNVLNVQELIRLIVKSYLQGIRGPTNIEQLRVLSFPKVQFYVGTCPHCHLRVDKQDFPTLVKKGENCICHVCGCTFSVVEVN